MNNLVTINPFNVKLISEYFTNLIFQLLYNDKLFAEILSVPEISQQFEQVIDQFFQQSVSKNIQLDVSKMSDLSRNFDKITPKSNQEDEYSDENQNTFNDIESENFLSERNAKNFKNIKIAQWQAKLISTLIPLLKRKLGPLLAPLISTFPFIEDIFNILLEAIESLISVLNNAIIEKFDPEFWKEVMLAYNAYDAINESKRSEMYSTEAYNRLLENDKVRGYGGQLHSQGAYEVIGPELKQQFSNQVIQNPDLVNSRFKDDPNVGPAVKNKFKQLIATNNKRFVKVAQQEMSEASQQKLDELQKIIPNWNINTVLREVYAVYQSPDIPQDEKQQAVDTTISKYLRAASPLRNFLKENNFANPDTAK